MGLKKVGLLLLAVFGCPIAAPGQPQAASGNVAEQYLQTAADEERAALGLSPLRLDPALATAARAHALQMAAHGGISHQFAGELDLAGRGAAAGARFSLISENVAESPSAVLIHAAWMRSEGHRHNLLDPNVDAVGISVVASGRRLFAVEDFERSLADRTFEQQEAAVVAAISPSGIVVKASGETARKICEGDEGSTAGPRATFVMRYTTENLSRLPDQLRSQIATGAYSTAVVAACTAQHGHDFSMYRMTVLLYR